MIVVVDKYKDPTPEQTPTRVILKSTNNNWPTAFPVQLQSRMSSQDWRSSIDAINQVAASGPTCAQTCLAVICCLFGGLCWLISKGKEQEDAYKQCFDRLDNEVFRPKGMQISLQTATKLEPVVVTRTTQNNDYQRIGTKHHHHQHSQTVTEDRTVTVRWIQIDILSSPSISQSSPMLSVICPTCKGTLTFAQGPSSIVCSTCQTTLVLGNPS